MGSIQTGESGDTRVVQKHIVVQKMDNTHGEKLVVSDLATTEPVYRQRLNRSEDEYLNLAPPELWEATSVVPDDTIERKPEPESALSRLSLPIGPDVRFGKELIWGATDTSVSDTSAVSEFAFGLPWQYLSRSWQI